MNDPAFWSVANVDYVEGNKETKFISNNFFLRPISTTVGQNVNSKKLSRLCSLYNMSCFIKRSIFLNLCLAQS